MYFFLHSRCGTQAMEVSGASPKSHSEKQSWARHLHHLSQSPSCRKEPGRRGRFSRVWAAHLLLSGPASRKWRAAPKLGGAISPLSRRAL